MPATEAMMSGFFIMPVATFKMRFAGGAAASVRALKALAGPFAVNGDDIRFGLLTKEV